MYVAKPDGTELTLVTPEPISAIASYAFSPDGRELLISTNLGIASTMLIASIDGKATHTLVVGDLIPSDPSYRPPDGGEILFVGQAPGAAVEGLYSVRSDGSGLRPVVAPTDWLMVGPIFSPDGTKIAYSAIRADYETTVSALLRVYIVGADGQTPRILRDLASPGDLETVAAWSNDGTRLLISGCYRSEAGVEDCPSAMEVVPVGGSGPVVRLDFAAGFPGADGTSQAWAPDDSAIITTPLSAQGTPMGDALAWDALTGRSRPVQWSGAGPTSWQRVH